MTEQVTTQMTEPTAGAASGLVVRRLDAAEARAQVGALGRVLVDCVAGGASVSFMWPFTQRDGEAVFTAVAEEVAAGAAALIAAFIGHHLVGTVQVGLAMPPNQPHRAEVRKMLVIGAARRAGIGAALLAAAESVARASGRSLACLDTLRGTAAERLYRRSGWIEVGAIPGYALLPNGEGPRPTVIFYKELPP
jgi:GNAT superfamily N-acetyltransferase